MKPRIADLERHGVLYFDSPESVHLWNQVSPALSALPALLRLARAAKAVAEWGDDCSPTQYGELKDAIDAFEWGED